MALKKTIIEPSWEAKYSFSPAVVTEGGKTIWLAGHVGFVDDAGASLAGVMNTPFLRLMDRSVRPPATIRKAICCSSPRTRSSRQYRNIPAKPTLKPRSGSYAS